MSTFGEDGLRVELHTFDRELAMSQPHNDAVLGRGGDLQTIGHGATVDYEGVVARRRKWILHPLEHSCRVVVDIRGLTMHDLRRAHHFPAVDLPDALMAEAYAQHRDTLLCERANRFVRYPGIFRTSGPRRYEHGIGFQRAQLRNRYLVVSVDSRLGAEFPEVLHEVVYEGVVIIDDEDPCSHAAYRTRRYPALMMRLRRKAKATVKERKPKPSRYTPPSPSKPGPSPMWVPVTMFALLLGGLGVIMLNYVNLLPGEADNKFLFVGLGMITLGFGFATRLR